MSEQESTDGAAQPVDFHVPIEPSGCFASVSDSMLHRAEDIRIAEMLPGDERVTACMGNTMITLTPRVWAQFIAGLLQVPGIAAAAAVLATEPPPPIAEAVGDEAAVAL